MFDTFKYGSRLFPIWAVLLGVIMTLPLTIPLGYDFSQEAAMTNGLVLPDHGAEKAGMVLRMDGQGVCSWHDLKGQDDEIVFRSSHSSEYERPVGKEPIKESQP